MTYFQLLYNYILMLTPFLLVAMLVAPALWLKRFLS